MKIEGKHIYSDMKQKLIFLWDFSKEDFIDLKI